VQWLNIADLSQPEGDLDMSKRPAQMMAVCVTLALGLLATACSSSSESSPTTSGSSSTTAAVSNLTATAAVKAELLAAGAVYNKLTSADPARNRRRVNRGCSTVLMLGIIP